MSDSPFLEFVDTNVLIYAHDATAGDKQAQAIRLLDRLWHERIGCLSVQVLQELAVNLTRKVPRPLPIPQVESLVESLGEWRVHCPELPDVIAALQGQQRHQLSFWDAMILQSAAQMGCRVVWSEDLSDGRDYDGVTVRNPFQAAAD